MSVQKGGRKTFNKSKSKAEGSSPLRIPACAIRIMEFTLSKDAKPFNKSKSKAEGSSPLRIPACAIRIMEFTLSKDAKPFCSFPHNKLLFCSHNIGYTDAGELMGGKLRKSVLHVMRYTQLISSSCFRQVL